MSIAIEHSSPFRKAHSTSTSAAPTAGPELSIIVPTFNERGNVRELLRRIEKCLSGIRWEVIFVDDDSPDETAALVRSLAQRDNRVRCVQRIGRRGLSSACVEGMLASSAPYLAVMDGDLQHDETLLGPMLGTMREDETDIVVGSRYMNGGGIGEWAQSRAAISRLATRLSHLVLKAELSDPMSGFFMMRREVLDRAVRGLSGIGFKILLDLFASSPQGLRYKELPYEFRRRNVGESKLDTRAVWDYVMLLLDKLIGHIVPVRFVAFSFVGGIGILVHLFVITVLFTLLGLGFVASQSIATVVAMTSNYALNNALTYRDMKLQGLDWFKGWASFSVACSVGALANVGVASYLFILDRAWLVASIAGVAVGAVWNYAMTTVYTWKRKGA